MDLENVVESLNDRQREAVTADRTNLLVFAGAGSGKTRVLVSRIAWLIAVENVMKREIMAVTFTNKAAGEIRARLARMLDEPVPHYMWVGTFHSLCARFLRENADRAGLRKTFPIYDGSDQKSLVKRLLKDRGLNSKEFSPRDVLSFIEGCKGRGLRADDVQLEPWQMQKQYYPGMLALYHDYEDALKRSGACDYTELLLRTYEVLRDDTETREMMQRHFSEILIDEFQDTSTLQFRLVRLLAGPECHVTAVGDDDQSIYGWRGADFRNIMNFPKTFSPVKVVTLDQNYRSTGNILTAANSVILNNRMREPKKLWTAAGAGEKVRFYELPDGAGEADFIVSTIRDLRDSGEAERYSDFAILYRGNAQSREIEQLMVEKGVPYRIYGGLRFYDRQEVKDALAYISLVADSSNDEAFSRVVNVPPRGIGAKTIETIRGAAEKRNGTLAGAARFAVDNDLITGRSGQGLSSFLRLIESLRSGIEGKLLPDAVRYVVEGSGLMEYYSAADEKEKKGFSEARTDNLEELVNSVGDFSFDAAVSDSGGTEKLNGTPRGVRALEFYLEQIFLNFGERTEAKDGDAVQLMTMHSSKGLEFPVVFIAGFEAGIFPSERSADSPSGLEEERRLCYVAMTRARKKLYLSCAARRSLYGGTQQSGEPSQFLREIDPSCLMIMRTERGGVLSRSAGRGLIPADRPKTGVTIHTESNLFLENLKKVTALRPGNRVRHPKYGLGTVVGFVGEGKRVQIRIQFDDDSCRVFLAIVTRLEKVADEA
ncbi:MAG: UvrD-helicase domain-containing protein [Succinivibrionaceae bacterium]|nr:UvrD-helicase domain-containing protein [Succinivibrionaceae bacterium]